MSTEANEDESSKAEPVEVSDSRRAINNQFLKVMKKQRSQMSLMVNDSAGGKNFDEVYDMGEVLGEGGFAFVYRCTHLTNNEDYAVKEVLQSAYNSPGENLNEEIDSLKLLRDGPYVVRLFDVFKEVDRTCMVMELMHGGDLLDRLGEKEVYSEYDARKVSRTLIEAINFCHKKMVCHRDIKPENILLMKTDDDCHIKLADFGCAKMITGPKCLHTLCGSPQYVAPELLVHEDGYNEKCDLWSAGIVIYVLLGGYAPFDAPEEELAELITNGFYEFHDEYWGHISKPPKDLVNNLLKVDPEGRYNAEEALDSKWLRRRDSNLSGADKSFDAWLKRSGSQKSLIIDDDD